VTGVAVGVGYSGCRAHRGGTDYSGAPKSRRLPVFGDHDASSAKRAVGQR